MNNPNLKTETWEPIAGFEGLYDVSDSGDVYSHLTHKNLRPARRADYLGVTLRRNGESHSFYVHHLVARAFIGIRPDGMDICHKNGQRSDNRADNLRYDTRHSNMRDSVMHGTHRSVSKEKCSKGHVMTHENTYRLNSKSADGGDKFRNRCRECLKSKSRRDYEVRKLRLAAS